ncbi:response regulator [Paenibacillus sp. LHD-117]|uniref:response regulator transcription factor n=1 Tax=Paenibacillus sp. LHD-117 TaxID=3071412 RepID=UPI0027E0CA86|nr:response regulator [Paenibacillus sp. LHD-117]MDQ6422720.1 response regulator [Paenibacillus sp. LHD-117]
MTRKVLIVDDEQMIGEMIVGVTDWRQFGLEIAGIVNDGVEAQSAIEAMSDIDILITDIQMPNMNGLELMGWLRSTNRKSRIIVLSAYDDFQYLREAMKLGIDNYLLKPLKKDELESTLEQIMQSFEQETTPRLTLIEGEDMIRTHVLNQLIMNNYSIRDITDKCLLLNIPNNKPPFQTIVIDTVTRQAPRSLFEERQLCQFAILNIVEELTREDRHLLSFGSSSGEVVLLLSETSNRWTPFHIREMINKIIMGVKESLHIDLLILIGKPSLSWRTIHQSYESAKERLNYRFFLDKTVILENTQDEIQSQREVMADQMGLAPLYEAIERNQFYLLETLLLEVHKSTLSLNASQIDLWRSVCIDFIRVCQEQLQKMEINVADIHGQYTEWLQRLLTAGSLDILWQALAGIVKSFIELTENIKMNRSDNIMEEIKDYIDANYRDNLTLQFLAQRFDITPSYLGKRFRMLVKESFNDYLNRIRIDKSQQLLKTTRDPANEISLQVGFVDPNYFYRQFKKYTGCSPTEYRKKE